MQAARPYRHYWALYCSLLSFPNGDSLAYACVQCRNQGPVPPPPPTQIKSIIIFVVGFAAACVPARLEDSVQAGLPKVPPSPGACVGVGASMLGWVEQLERVLYWN